MAISVPNDDARASHPSFPAVGRNAVGGGSHEHGGFKIFVGLAVAAGVAFAGIKWQQGRINSSAIADKAFGGHLEPGTEVFTFAIVTVGVLPDNLDLTKLDDKTYR